MIEYLSQTDFQLENSEAVTNWISDIIESKGKIEGDISYVFCDDEYLLAINKEFLNHDTLTDIISFDYSLGDQIHGEIYISVERVKENAEDFKVDFLDELHRVMIHGILHYCGFGDKSEKEALEMRGLEETALGIRNFV
jgi:rRNA maturation RNase YbeY